MDNQLHVIKDFYNAIADDYAQEEYENDNFKEIILRFISLLPPSPRVLDMGCGAGYRSRELKLFGADVTGIDISEKAIQIAKVKNPNCHFEVLDFMNIDDSLGYFDGVISIGTFAHINDFDLPRVFAQINKTLKVNGLLLLIVCDGNGELQSHFSKKLNNNLYEFVNYFYDKDKLNKSAREQNIVFIENWELPKKYSQKGYKCYLYRNIKPRGIRRITQGE